ncbi:hypothetical protein AN639_07825 [Candidatus Epulonipiscium fishelsonii]|uniref:Uncharacterized protein n=1 Tax=Candidatus Epulonipiscium fishelsonii TaxID=77094 RepID=A0ACC8X8L9_9FIRM|nr:hypothetical protein AN396_11015 [Epulopiscium sp. SCG-B11WGA-EpuloA1]ONI38404.1 hypothetical protein AN639_07825 [Epulopiscium sp. SCG-B05WGA-EpuloA1]
MKKFLKIISVLSLIGLVTGCSGDTSEQSQTADKTVLKVQWIGDFKQGDSTDPITGAKRKGLYVIEEEFERLYPEVDLQFVLIGWDDYVKKTQTMIMSNDADVYQVPGISGLVDQELLVPLDSYIQRDNYDLSIYLDGQVEGWKVAGPNDTEVQIYSLPFLGDTRVISYDKEIFDQWGVEYLSENPTVEEILEKASKMTGINPVTGIHNYGFTFRGAYVADALMNINEALGGVWGSGIKMREIVTAFNSDTMVEASNILLDLLQYAPETALSDQGSELYGMPNNNIAINFHDVPLTIFAAQELGLSDKYGVSKSFINEQEGMGGMFTGSPLAIAVNSENKDLGWEYIKFAASDFMQQYLWENQRHQALPVTKAGLNFEGISGNQNITTMIESMEQLWTPRYIYRASQPRYILTDAAQNIMLGEPIQETLDKAQKETEEWVAQQ